MESSSKSFVYVRRGESEREANAMEDGRDATRDHGRIADRFEGKVMRKKRGLRDVAPPDKKYLSKFKRISERSDNSPDRDGERRRGLSGGKELSWKEIAERKGRNRILDGSGDNEGDGTNGKVSEGDRKERIDKGKVQSGSPYKGSKGAESKFPAKRKQGSGSLEFHTQNRDGKRKKSSEVIKKRRHRLILQDHSDDEDYYVRPLPVKTDPPEARVAEGKEADKETDPDVAAAVFSAGPPDQGVRKSSRVPKKKVLEDFEDDVPEVATPKNGRNKMGDGDGGKSESPESDSNDENEAGASDRTGSESDADARDWMDISTKSKQAKTRDVTKTPDSLSNGVKGRSAPLTARQRSIQLEKDGNESLGLNLIEFPDGLSQFSRRGTAKLTLEDRQAKKAEAASRRKQVVEKAAKEMQATAIQKILGQDSSRRKKEERLQKQREEIEQGKKAAALEAPANSVRWTLGPQGTTVSWSQDAQLPEIFSHSVYPLPPQLCAAPYCNHPRKYRDSKSNLPLCSLECYRMVNHSLKLVST